MRKLILVGLLGLSACAVQEPESEGASQPGIKLIPLAVGLSKAAQALASGPLENLIRLDTLTGSFVQYFILQNTGNSDIRNVEIKTNHPQFSFKPSKLEILAPGKLMDLGGQRIVGLYIQHGSKSPGGSYDPTLPTGENCFSTSITGTVTDKSNKVEALEETFTLSAFAKLLDLGVFDGESELDLLHPLGRSLTPLSPDLVPTHSINGDSLLLVNNGNVDLEIHHWKSAADGVSMAFNLTPGARVHVAPGIIALYGGDVTSDQKKLPIADDGRVYLSFIKPPPAPDEEPPPEEFGPLPE